MFGLPATTLIPAVLVFLSVAFGTLSLALRNQVEYVLTASFAVNGTQGWLLPSTEPVLHGHAANNIVSRLESLSDVKVPVIGAFGTKSKLSCVAL